MKKFLILLLALLLPVCASAAITVPEHVTEIGAEAFAGVNTDYLVIPASVKTVGANVLTDSNASYLWLEGASTQVAGNPGVPFIFGPAGSAAAGVSGFYAQESLVTDSGLYYAVLEDKALPLCAVNPSSLSGGVIIPKTLGGKPVTSVSQLHLSNTRLTEVHIPRYLTAPEGLPVTTYVTMFVDAPIAAVTETPAGKYVTWSIAGYSGNHGEVSFVWTFENGGNTVSTTTTEPFIKYAPMQEGTCTATVRVVDAVGDWAEATGEAITVTEGQPIYRALLVGNSYPGAANELKGPENDITAVRAFLSTMSGTPYRITPARNLTGTGMQAAIASAFAGAEPGDISLFYYSGHGTEAGALVGTRDSLGRDTFLSVYGLRSALEKIPGTKIVILDCCYSGNVIGRSASPEDTGSPASFNNAVISAFGAVSRSSENLEDAGYIVLTACRKDQRSNTMSDPSNGNFFGVFTYGLCYGSGYDEWQRISLSDMPADADSNRAISLGEAIAGVKERLAFIKNMLPSLNQDVQYHGDPNFILWAK